MSTTDQIRPVRLRHRTGPARAISFVALAVALLGALCAPSAVGAQEAPTSQVTVVHGLRGQLVDVYLDGELLLEGFEPDRLTDPMTVHSGVHTVDLRPAGTPATDPPKATASPDVPPGPVSVVAHFAPDGSWTMSLFTNGSGDLGAGTGRVVFRNTASVSPVDVELAGASTPVPALATGAEADQDLPAASYGVQVASPDGQTLVPSNDIAVDAVVSLILYLVGQGTDVTWLSQRVDGSAAAPSGVAAGNSGLVAPDQGRSSPPLAGLLALAVVVLAGGVVLTSSRRRAARS
ncbi:hypothetical protein BH10ACT3_BH10ACT3_10090 [soil metagenome]